MIPRVKELEVVLRTEFDALARRQPAETDTRVAGLLGGIALADHLKAEQICVDLIELGFIARPLRGNTVQISPHFVISDQELRLFVAGFEQAITEREKQ